MSPPTGILRKNPSLIVAAALCVGIPFALMRVGPMM